MRRNRVFGTLAVLAVMLFPLGVALRFDHADFATAYARSEQIRARGMADDLIDLADTATAFNNGAVRLQVETRKWLLARLYPEKYGEKVDFTGTLTLSLEDLVVASFDRQAKTIDHEEVEDGDDSATAGGEVVTGSPPLATDIKRRPGGRKLRRAREEAAAAAAAKKPRAERRGIPW